jgi:glycerol-3-phosphate acyltransferase PlsY
MQHNLIFLLLLSYFLGSIPFGLIFTKVFGYGDIRRIGSKNIGATNVLRTGNKLLSLLTLICDFFKGFVPVYYVGVIYKDIYISFFCGITAVLGHVFSIYLKFKGGKGVATTYGFVLAFLILENQINLFIIMTLSWLIIFFTTKYVALSSIISLLTLSILSINYIDQKYFLFLSILTLIIIFKHSDNIRRIKEKKEKKINF